MMPYINILCTIVLILHSTPSHGNFLGGSINWYFLGGKVRFTYRLTWERGSGPCGPGCTASSVNKTGTLSPLLNIFKWTCTSGCITQHKLNGINYVVTSVGSGTRGWEQGEGQFSFSAPAQDQYEISLSGFRWSTAANGPAKMVTTVDLRHRSDTGLPNASPIAAVQPTIRVKAGCKSTVVLPVIDPDADTIKCKLASSAECGAACTTLPGIQIDNNKCMVTIPSSTSSGDYRLTVVAEDFPRGPIQLGGVARNPNQPLSKIPLQLTIHVIKTSDSCSQQTQPDLNMGSSSVYPAASTRNGNLKTLYLPSNTADVLISTAAGVVQSKNTDASHPNSIKVATYWWPSSSQDGPSFTCVWGLQHDGLTSSHQCFTTYVGDQDDCSGGNKCAHGGTCIDLYKRYTCQCLGGYTSNDCSIRTTCKNASPCVLGTCEERKSTLFCVCPPDYTGTRCESKVNNCSGAQCVHNVFTSCGVEVVAKNYFCNDVTGGITTLTPTSSIGIANLLGAMANLPAGQASFQYRATVASQSGQLNVLGAVKVSDNSKEDIKVVVNNSSPPLWPIGVAIGGTVVLILVGCIAWWCCVSKGGQQKGRISPTQQWADRSPQSPRTPNTRGTSKSGQNHVTQIESNTGTQVSGGSPKILNIYQSSANDPHIHTCGKKSPRNFYQTNTFM